MKKFLLSLLCLVMLGSPSALAFSDVTAASTNDEAISVLQQKGIVQGYADGTFRPGYLINRAEFLKLVVQTKFTAQEVQSGQGAKLLADVPSSEWYAPYVRFAINKDIIDGYPDGTFKPANNVNLAEALKIVVEAYGIRKPVYIRQPDHWYDEYMAAASGANLLVNVSASEPGTLLTRGDMAQIMYNVMQPKPVE